MSESVGLLSPPPRRQSLASAAWDSAFSPGSRRASHATINGHGGIASRKSSVVSSFAPFGNLQEDVVDPEELFVKHTVAEVRAVQRKLKTEADSKQEELRLMVGERYRDLLQASASIISMDQSSQQVLDAIDDMQSVIEDDFDVRQFKRSAASQKDDAELRSLQTLTAHIKLLMDAPEHLWRLLERKKYLEAAWLFLLARVVHRSLSSDEGDEEDGWQDDDMDVLDQFPIAQRQWDAIAHFRPQISSKAALSLRDTSHLAEDVCGTLLALHLIDSKPLTEALSVFIVQRSKTVQHLIARNPELLLPVDAPVARTKAETKEKARRKAQARAVRDAITSVLEALASTVVTARNVFEEQPTASGSLIHRSLEFVEQDENLTLAASLPDSLQLSTRRFLTKLPSSSHFQHLPPAIRSYKPYIDLSSTSTTVKASDLAKRLDSWFPEAVEQFQGAAESWLADIQSVRHVWMLLLWVRSFVQSSALLVPEKEHIISAMDHVSRQRIVTIWKTSLQSMEREFQSALQVALDDVSVVADGVADSAELEQLFQVLPILESAGTTITANGFQRYHDHLHNSLAGRTPALDSILSPLEARARRIRMDVERMRHDEPGTQSLVDNLLQVYDPESASTRSRIITSLSSRVDSYMEGSSAERVPRLLLLARLVETLSATSDFAADISAGPQKTQEFKQEALALYTRIMDTWRRDVVLKAVADYQEALMSELAARPLFQMEAAASASTQPSGSLMDALLVLCTAAQRLGAPIDSAGRASAVVRMLRLLVDELLREKDGFTPDESQFQSDMQFVGHVTSLWADELASSRTRLDERFPLDSPEATAGHLARVQLLLDPLLPPAAAADGGESIALLRFGAPTPEGQQMQPVLDVARPSQRFGLLMVGSVAP